MLTIQAEWRQIGNVAHLETPTRITLGRVRLNPDAHGFQINTGDGWEDLPRGEDAKAAVEHAVGATGWQTGTPEKPGTYLVAARNEDNKPVVLADRWNGHWWENRRLALVTHWQPLPSPPKD